MANQLITRPEIVTSVIPLCLDYQNDENVFPLQGTAFLYKHNGEHVIITAHHCVLPDLCNSIDKKQKSEKTTCFFRHFNRNKGNFENHFVERAKMRNRQFSALLNNLDFTWIKDFSSNLVLPDGVDFDHTFLSSFIESRVAEIGDNVILLGYPDGFGMTSDFYNLAFPFELKGIITEKEQNIIICEIEHKENTILNGASGGPVFLVQGTDYKLLGMAIEALPIHKFIDGELTRNRISKCTFLPMDLIISHI